MERPERLHTQERVGERERGNVRGGQECRGEAWGLEGQPRTDGHTGRERERHTGIHGERKRERERDRERERERKSLPGQAPFVEWVRKMRSCLASSLSKEEG